MLVKDLKFKSLVDYDRISDLPYFDRFTKVRYLKHNHFQTIPRIPKLIEEIHLRYKSSMPAYVIKAKRVVIDYLINDLNHEHEIEHEEAEYNPEDDSQSESEGEIHNNSYSKLYSTIISLKHIQCREMIIENINTPCTIEFFHGLERLVIEDWTKRVALVLPESLKYLHAEDIIINSLPSNLKEISCYRITQGLSIVLPATSEKSFSRLPETLEAFNVVKVDKETYNMLLSCYKSLPLKSLTISSNDSINPTIEFDLHSLKDLESLCLIGFVNLELSSLPPKLKKLCITCDEYNKELPKLPETLKELSFNVRSYHFPISSLPELETLELYGKFSERISFPETLKKLDIHDYPHKIDFSRLRNLKILELGNYEYELTDLCDGLEELIFRDFSKFNNTIILPDSLKRVEFGSQFNREVCLPESLEEISFSGVFNQKITLPSKLKKLFLSNCFNQKLDLPESLEALFLGNCFNQPIDKFPSRLKYLRIGEEFSHSLPPLPKTLKTFEDDRCNANDNIKYEPIVIHEYSYDD
jgi:hypothetical protein